MPAILTGLKVLDLTSGFAGSLATMIMADNGAEVTKVEPPAGDPHRVEPAWIMWNRGKKSVVLDLESTQGRADAQRLADADVVIENFRPGRADQLGLGYDELSRSNPGLIYCSITGLGPAGAYRSLKPYEAVVAAKAGQYLQVQGFMGRKVPTYRVRPTAGYGAGQLAVQGIVSALRVRDRTGRGQRVETSLYSGIAVYDPRGAIDRQAELGLVNMPPSRSSRGLMHRPMWWLAYLVVRCKDGQWLQMTNQAFRLFRNWMHAIGLGHIFEDERFKGMPAVLDDEAAQDLRRMILERMQEKTLDEWIEVFLAKDIPGDRLLTTQQAMDHPQIIHNGSVVELDDPAVGKTQQIGPLISFSLTPSEIGAPAPLPGQHTAEVLQRPGTARAPVPAGRDPLPAHPLAGMLVLDFSNWLASPLGTALVADLGARVIKIESLDGDEFRRGQQGRGATFNGKESLVVDLKSEDGRAVVAQLLQKADALVHNMRGGTSARLGLDRETVSRLNPNIVYVYAGSYGSTGPGAGRGAFHPTAGAMSGGALWQLGKGNQPPAADVPLSIDEVVDWSRKIFAGNETLPDQTSGISVATALVLGLYHKERTGQGQYIETSMITSNCYLASDDFIRYDGKPPREEADRELRGLHALHRLYHTAEGWVMLSCSLQEEWVSLCRAIDRPDLASDQRFATGQARRRHDDELIAILGLVFKERSADEWEQLLATQDVACVRADGKSFDDFFLTDPNIKENGYIVQAEDPKIGPFFRRGPGVTFSLTPAVAKGPALFGGDTPRILQELGVPSDRIDDLARRGIVKWEAAPVSGSGEQPAAHGDR